MAEECSNFRSTWIVTLGSRLEWRGILSLHMLTKLRRNTRTEACRPKHEVESDPTSTTAWLRAPKLRARILCLVANRKSLRPNSVGELHSQINDKKWLRRSGMWNRRKRSAFAKHSWTFISNKEKKSKWRTSPTTLWGPQTTKFRKRTNWRSSLGWSQWWSRTPTRTIKRNSWTWIYARTFSRVTTSLEVNSTSFKKTMLMSCTKSHQGQHRLNNHKFSKTFSPSSNNRYRNRPKEKSLTWVHSRRIWNSLTKLGN